MKKKCFVLILLITFLTALNINFNITKADNNSYARILSSSTYLYSSPNIEEENKFFLLEKTYFVKIISTVNDFYKVKYFNVSGYVLTSEVEIVNGIPNKPYPENITFNINSSLNTKIRTSTSMKDDNNVIGLLPNSNCEIHYIASTNGEESIKNLGSKWYYCYYIYENNSCIYGFVYAPLTENITQIVPNTETFSAFTETIKEEETPVDISQKQNLLIVVVLCLPAVIIVFLLVLPLNKKNSTNKSVKKVSRKSKKDFYEID